MSGEIQQRGQIQSQRRPSRVKENSITARELSAEINAQLAKIDDLEAGGGDLILGGLDASTVSSLPAPALLTSANI